MPHVIQVEPFWGSFFVTNPGNSSQYPHAILNSSKILTQKCNFPKAYISNSLKTEF